MGFHFKRNSGIQPDQIPRPLSETNPSRTGTKQIGKVSVVIPVYNEEAHIERCLDSILSSDFPQDQYEIIVVDGGSQDRSRDIVQKKLESYHDFQLIEHPERRISALLNVGIKHSSGDVIAKIEGHSVYPRDYLSQCVRLLSEYDADNVGGVWKVIPRRDTPTARAIATVLSHRFGGGSAHTRIGSKTLQWAETVYSGCYKRSVFEGIGFYNENLVRSTDMDFNVRLRKAGGKILLSGDIVTSYYPVPVDLRGFWRRNITDGFWVTYPLKFRSRIFYWRHLVPTGFVLGIPTLAGLSFISLWFLGLLLAGLGAYGILSVVSSVSMAKQERSFKMLGLLPITFATRHIAYGLGSLLGLVKVLLPTHQTRGNKN